MTTNNLSQKLYPAFREGIIILAVALFIAIAFNSMRSNNIPLFGFSSAALIKEQQAKIPSITLSEVYDLYRKIKSYLLTPAILLVLKKAISLEL
jgi:hypothetical protein